MRGRGRRSDPGDARRRHVALTRRTDVNTVFGIIFSNATGESAELAIESGTLHVLVRATSGGMWSEWKRIDISRSLTGELEGTVQEAATARMAHAARKLATPVRISFTGDIAGAVSFDGTAPDVKCQVSGVTSAIDAAIAAHEEHYHRYSQRDGY